ncbi:MAG TPA: carbonic anhydrase [Acidimicrobiia bacterium]|nr:carbonic anhydrase [Acidimicrobiia bacterium]
MTSRERFAAVINCMDGRIQTRTIDQLMTRFGARHIDNITSTGAVQHFDGTVTATGEGLLRSLAVSIDAHGTTQVAVVAHSQCAGNPVPDAKQKEQLRKAIVVVAERFPKLEVIGLFLDPRIGYERIR